MLEQTSSSLLIKQEKLGFLQSPQAEFVYVVKNRLPDQFPCFCRIFDNIYYFKLSDRSLISGEKTINFSTKILKIYWQKAENAFFIFPRKQALVSSLNKEIFVFSKSLIRNLPAIRKIFNKVLANIYGYNFKNATVNSEVSCIHQVQNIDLTYLLKSCNYRVFGI